MARDDGKGISNALNWIRSGIPFLTEDARAFAAGYCSLASKRISIESKKLRSKPFSAGKKHNSALFINPQKSRPTQQTAGGMVIPVITGLQLRQASSMTSRLFGNCARFRFLFHAHTLPSKWAIPSGISTLRMAGSLLRRLVPSFLTGEPSISAKTKPRSPGGRAGVKKKSGFSSGCRKRCAGRFRQRGRCGCRGS